MHALSKLKNFIFPIICLGCDTLSGNVICDSCMQEIYFIKGRCCRICGFEFNNAQPDDNDICANCISDPPIFSKARAAILYNENSKHIIQRFKFQDAVYAAKLYAQWMIKYGQEDFSNIDVIIPVPLHRLRLLSRGYNQSSLLANIIATHVNIAVDHLAISRIKNTLPQSSLSTYKKRFANVKNAFVVKNKPNVLDKKILLIDDIMTTGATLTSCTSILLKSGAKSVNILTIART